MSTAETFRVHFTNGESVNAFIEHRVVGYCDAIMVREVTTSRCIVMYGTEWGLTVNDLQQRMAHCKAMRFGGWKVTRASQAGIIGRISMLFASAVGADGRYVGRAKPPTYEQAMQSTLDGTVDGTVEAPGSHFVGDERDWKPGN